MLNIRPISDLRNKFTDIERTVQDGNPVYLTKNGYGVMVVLSLEAYSQHFDETEQKLDEADKAAQASPLRKSHKQVFRAARRRLHATV
jgi:prevent-host-death family protein